MDSYTSQSKTQNLLERVKRNMRRIRADIISSALFEIFLLFLLLLSFLLSLQQRSFIPKTLIPSFTIV